MFNALVSTNALVSVNVPALDWTVENCIFPDSPEFRATLVNMLSSLRLIKLAEDGQKLSAALKAEETMEEEKVVLRVKLSQNSARQRQETALIRATEGETALFIDALVAAGNRPETVRFILALLASCKEKSLRKYVIKGFLPFFNGGENSPAALFFTAFDKVINPEKGFDKSGRSKAPAADFALCRKVVESLFKGIFSLPFTASTMPEKFRAKIDNRDFGLIMQAYCPGLSVDISTDKKTGVVSIGSRAEAKTSIVRKEKKGIVTYNADKFLDRILVILLSKMGQNEE